jgi:DNA-binding NtrC family response regulator
VESIDPEALRLLTNYEWRGNIRELENTICRSMILCEAARLTVADLPPRIRGESSPGETASSDLDHLPLTEAVHQATEKLERRILATRLAEHRGNRTATAESLGISRKTLFNKLRQYRIESE